MALRATGESSRTWRLVASSGAVAIALLGACAVASSAGCAGKQGEARSPEQAYLQVLGAVDSGDAARLFDALDTETQWAIETVHKLQREMRKLAVADYPPAERDVVLRRLPPACEEALDHPRRYFRRLDDSATTLAELKQRLYAGTGQPIGSVQRRAGMADVWREGGSIFHFARDEGGRWGYVELREIWQHNKERAIHEADTVRENAALYRRRAPAGGEKGSTP